MGAATWVGEKQDMSSDPSTPPDAAGFGQATLSHLGPALQDMGQRESRQRAMGRWVRKCQILTRGETGTEITGETEEWNWDDLA